ncbi:MAG: hypothetical protein AB2421_17445 [Thermotaleaceae bacterium]
MPLPFLLAGAAAVAGLAGVAKGVEAMSANEEAKELLDEAKEIFDSAKEEMELSKEEAAYALAELGKKKLLIWDKQFGKFTSLVGRLKNVSVDGKAAVDEKLYKAITENELGQMKEMSLKAGEIVSGGVTSLGAGALAGVASYGGAMMFASASTGTAISTLSGAAAANATMAWFGGGSLAAGGLGVAGGTAVLGGIVAGPVFAIGGMIMASKAKANLAEAKKKYAQAEEAAEEMNNASSMLNAITKLSEQFYYTIDELDGKMTVTLNNLESMLVNFENSKERSFGFKFKKFFAGLVGKKMTLDYDELTDNEKRLIHTSYQIAQVMKAILERPILKQDGAIDPEAKKVLGPAKTIQSLPAA